MRHKGIIQNTKTLVYYISQEELNGKAIEPSIPNNFFTKHKIGDTTTNRIVFHTSMDGALISAEPIEKGFYNVYVPYEIIPYKNFYFPKEKESPTSSLTNEVWLKEKTYLSYVGKILILGKSEEPKDIFKYPFTSNGKRKILLLNRYKWKWVFCHI